MQYNNIKPAVFKSRPNRFIAYGEVEGKEVEIHVKNTGRCKELLIPDRPIYLQYCDNPARKTKWDLISVQKGKRLINIDSQAPNQVVREFLESGKLFGQGKPILVQSEVVYGDSRFDFYVEVENRKIFIEVKGVTLEQDGLVMFPDAPSDRAVKHVEGLIKAVAEGFESYVFFVIQMEDVKYFTPHTEMQAEFTEALKKANKAGVQMMAYDCKVRPDRMEINRPVDVVL